MIYQDAFLIPGSLPDNAKTRKLMREIRNRLRTDAERPESTQRFLNETRLKLLIRENLSKHVPVLYNAASL